MKVLHITDIHLKSEYDAQFPAMKHLGAIIKETAGMSGSLDAVVLTGDLVDNGTYEDYTDLFNLFATTYGTDMPILVTPGNHDNRIAMDEAYEDFRADKHWKNYENINFYGSFKHPGEAVTVMDMLGKTELGVVYQARSVVLMDTAHRGFPYPGLCNLTACREGASDAWPKYILFTHMPIIRPFHKFMNKPGFTIEDDGGVFLKALAKSRCEAIVCGHYHSESHMIEQDIRQYVGPANQAQIDPYSGKCNPSGNFPGYGILDDTGLIKYTTHYITNETTSEETK